MFSLKSSIEYHFEPAKPLRRPNTSDIRETSAKTTKASCRR
jgi:hypothetical protein